ncbi:adipocyte plasma membrane-associated protein-like [Dermatophagoides pteronyssinus]|uniref:adipocyte plasma membrane-associated protein-like n=1 Tax=Dermatophagoides pteronyssinus TaxID=6956 RepID=UPI003F6777F1
MILNLIIQILLCICLIASIIMFMPGCILLDIRPKIYPAQLPRSLDQFDRFEDLKINEFTKINLNDNNTVPESIAIYQGHLVTGSADSTLYLIKQTDNSVETLVKIIDDKTKTQNGHQQPIILGLQFDSKGVLFAVVLNYGIYKVEGIFSKTKINVKVSEVLSVEQTQTSTGVLSKFLDDIAIEERSNGEHILYITDLSTRYDFNQIALSLLSVDYSGRLLRYDMAENRLDILANNLLCPNGIVLLPDKTALLFSDFSKSVNKYWLKGSNAGKLEKIITNLPAELDNIRPSINGKTYWLAMSNPRTMKKPSEFDYFLKKPWLRTLILRTLHLIGMLFDIVKQIIPSNDFIDKMANDLKTVQGIHSLSELHISDGGMMIEFDSDGKIYQSIYTHNEELKLMSEIREISSKQSDQRILYIGSWKLPYIRKLVFSNKKSQKTF